MSKKVLIVYATGGMGHVTAARAVAQAFAVKYPDVAVKNVDIMDFAAPLYKKVFVDGYNWVSAKYPNIWGWLYRSFNNRSRQALPNWLSKRSVMKRFIAFVRAEAPDFIVTTHPLPTLLIAESTRQEMIDILSSIVITDFGCHSFWVNREVNYYFCATEHVAKCLGGYGVLPKQAIVSGIPIELKFSEPMERTAVAARLGLDPKRLTVLIVGGQFTFADLQTITVGIERQVRGVQFIIVAGRDKALKAALDQSGLNRNGHMKVFGFVDTMHELMTAADVIFSKAGGLTTSECMAKGLPMVIYKVIPGQEEDNVNYLVGRGAGIKVDTVEQIVDSVGMLLNDPQKLLAMKTAARSIGRPDAAIALADFVYTKIK